MIISLFETLHCAGQGHTSSRISRQQTSSIVSLNVHLSRHDLVIQSIHPPNMLIRKNRKGEVDQKDQSNSRMQKVRQESSLKTTNSRINNNYNANQQSAPNLKPPSKTTTKNELTSSRNQYPRRRNMHLRHPGHKLRTSENHASAPENIVDEVQHHENSMRVSAIADPNEF